ncbi:MAG: hypothetical protein ACYTAN_06690 [Planctomycetota bacterium]|jgi:vacuolar-type H+-ATPase subunit H
MTDVSLEAVLAAEKSAQARLREADDEAEAIRARATDEIEKLQRESTERIETNRKERLRDLENEIAGLEDKVFSEVKAEIADWENRYDRKRDELVTELSGLLKGKED